MVWPEGRSSLHSPELSLIREEPRRRGSSLVEAWSKREGRGVVAAHLRWRGRSEARAGWWEARVKHGRRGERRVHLLRARRWWRARREWRILCGGISMVAARVRKDFCLLT